MCLCVCLLVCSPCLRRPLSLLGVCVWVVLMGPLAAGVCVYVCLHFCRTLGCVWLWERVWGGKRDFKHRPRKVRIHSHWLKSMSCKCVFYLCVRRGGSPVSRSKTRHWRSWRSRCACVCVSVVWVGAGWLVGWLVEGWVKSEWCLHAKGGQQRIWTHTHTHTRSQWTDACTHRTVQL